MSLDTMVRQLGRHAELSDDDRRALAGVPFVRRKLNMGHYLARAGDQACEHIVLQSGYAHQHKIASAGGRQIVSIRMPGEAVSWTCLFFDRVDYSAQALTPIEAAVVQRDALRDLIAARPAVSKAILMATLIDAAISSEWLLNIGRRSAIARVAHLLCELAARMDTIGLADGASYQVPLTQEQMADILGLTGVHVNRMMKQLTESGVIARHGRCIQFPDRDRIARIAGFDARYLRP